MLCPICNTTAKHFEDTQMQWHFFHCNTCHFFFKDPEYYLSEDDEIKIYQNHNNTIEAPGYVAMFEEFIDKTFAPYTSEIETVLEFGSGPGPVLAELLKKRGLHVEIYDKFFSPQKVYESKQYDLITATEVMEHIATPQEIMHFFHKHLKEGGYLALMTQFHTNDESTFLQWWYRKDPTHISFFTPETFSLLAEQNGFELLRFDTKKNILLKKASYS